MEGAPVGGRRGRGRGSSGGVSRGSSPGLGRVRESGSDRWSGSAGVGKRVGVGESGYQERPSVKPRQGGLARPSRPASAGKSYRLEEGDARTTGAQRPVCVQFAS